MTMPDPNSIPATTLDALEGHVVILSGSPGSGKTTTAEMLARIPGRVPKVHLHSDDFWGYIKHGLIDPWLPAATAQNRMIMEIAAGVTGRYAKAGFLVALDGVIGPWSLSPYSALQIPLHYIVLRPPLTEAVARCEARGGDSLTDPVVVADLYAQFADLGPLERHALPTVGLDRRQALHAVIDALAGRAYRLSPTP